MTHWDSVDQPNCQYNQDDKYDGPNDVPLIMLPDDVLETLER